MTPWLKRRDPIAPLREVLGATNYSGNLGTLPTQLATIIQRYDGAPLDKHFRNDIYNILATSTAIAETLVDEVFSVDDAIQHISRQMEILARILVYLNSRPARTGYSLLIPKSGKLVGQFATIGEAEDSLTNMQHLGAAHNAIVVPVRVVSQSVVRPAAQPSAASPLADDEDIPIPPGVQPATQEQPPAQSAELLPRLEALEAQSKELVAEKPPTAQG